MTETTVVTSERVVRAPAEAIFELIADPARQPEWDGNDNLAVAEQGQRVRAVGDVFTVTLTKGTPRPNRVVAFEEGRVIAWRPAPTGEPEPGHEWRWELEPVEGGTLVRHVYDWTNLTDAKRFDKARSTTAEHLAASISRLAALAEAGA
ncbi:SRPBCC family protein [Pseudactinotalea terrae]|uniref:SRPBCC family protein n=1 Tax=Pseudactinotalea terrae TaxID=1743262 RepID=UPI0012E3174E|nr:SRPBCC family protein [Pseudactinotalea terrae]